MARQTPVGARSNRRRETVLLGKNAAGWLLEGAGDSAPREMIVRIERSDRTRLIGQRTSDNSALTGFLNRPAKVHRAPTSSEPVIFVRRLGVAFVFVYSMLGCAITQPIQATTQTAPIIAADSAVLSTVPPLIVHDETAIYDVQSITRTDEITPTPSVRDSFVFAEILHVALRPIEHGLYRFIISSELSPQPAPVSSARLVRKPKLLEAAVDSINGTFRIPHVLQLTACDTASTLLSPLLLRALVNSALVDANSSSSATAEAFTYVTCRAGLNILHTVNWFRASMKPNSIPSNIQATFSGHLTADSAVAFPMHLAGLLTGTSKVVPDTGTTLLPRQISLSTITQLHATNSTKQQHFQQQTQTVLIKR